MPLNLKTMLYCLNPACSHPNNPDHNANCQGCGFPLNSSQKGYLFQNRYLIVQLLKEENNKRAYLAYDQKEMDELRVIKKYIVSGSEAELKQAQEKFEKTADQLTKLNHPQVAKIYDYFVHNSHFYLVEEYIQGKILSAEIEEKIVCNEIEITIILRELLPVLSYLHRKNIIHGKINLNNIIRPSFFFYLQSKEAAEKTEVTIVDWPERAGQEHWEGTIEEEEIKVNLPSTGQPLTNFHDRVDPWLNNNHNQLFLPNYTSNNGSSESQLNLEQGIIQAKETREREENQHQNLEFPKSILGRGKKLVLINVSEGQVFFSWKNIKPVERLFFQDNVLPNLETELNKKNKSLLPSKDIHDLGVICIRLLTGYFRQTDEPENQTDPLYDEKNNCWLWRNVLARQQKIISKDLGIILDKMLQSSSTGGYQTAVEVIKDLYVDVSPELVLTAPKETAHFKRRKFLKLAGWGSLGLITTLGIGTGLRRGANWEGNLQRSKFKIIEVNDRGQVIKRQPKEAQGFTVDLGKGVTLEFVAVPGGKFLIGSSETEQSRNPNESPQQEITISPFFMSKYPVTQSQWSAIMGSHISWFKGRKRPVEQVSWYDCLEFCEKLSKQVNRECRLPSEAEWEYACRAGTTTAFHYGVTITSELANYNGQYTYLSEPQGLNRQKTTPVGSFPPNAFGLYDMHGNVWEWCADNWQDNYLSIPKNGRPWINEGIYRVLRGGAWLHEAYYCRSANRNNDLATARLSSFGCRVVVSATRTLNL